MTEGISSIWVLPKSNKFVTSPILKTLTSHQYTRRKVLYGPPAVDEQVDSGNGSDSTKPRGEKDSTKQKQLFSI